MRDIADFFSSHDKGYVTLPTGVGKTVIFSEIIRETALKTLIVVPTRQLVEQTKLEMNVAGIEDVSIVDAFNPEHKRGQVSIVTYASFVKHAKTPGGKWALNPAAYELVIFDEAHHSLADGASTVSKLYENAFQIGFTATPDYSEVRQLARVLPHKIHEMGIVESIDAGLITPFANVVLATNADMSNVNQTQHGDYESKALELAINTPARNQSIATFLGNTTKNKKTIVSCNGVDHAIEMAEALREQGIAAAAVYGQMPKNELAQVLEDFRAGVITAITNNKLLTEGFDDEEIEVIVNASPTLSIVREQQRSGRGLRINRSNANKQALIIDCLDTNYRVMPIMFHDTRVAGTTGLGALQPGLAELLSEMKQVVPNGMELYVTDEDIAANFTRVIAKKSTPTAKHSSAKKKRPLQRQPSAKPQKKTTDSRQKIESIALDLVGTRVWSKEWPKRGSCAQTDPEAFFPEKGGTTKDSKKVCANCEVSALCLARAILVDERFGVWGGQSERERRKLAKDPVAFKETLVNLLDINTDLEGEVLPMSAATAEV